jgi:hypothetical protein
VIDTKYNNYPKRGTVKKMATSIIIGLSVIALSACTVEVKENSGGGQRPTDTTAYTPPSQSVEDIYLEVVYDEYPFLYSQMGDSAMLQFGRTMCDSIDEGMTMGELAMMAVAENADAEMVGFILGAAVYAFCPENEWFLNTGV